MLAASLPEVDLGEAPGAELLAACERREKLRLLRLRPEQEDVRRAQTVVRRDRQRDGGGRRARAPRLQMQ